MQALTKFVIIKEVPSKGVALGDVNIREGEVVSTGWECDEELEKGDKVVFDTYKGIKYNIAGKDYYFVNYETIFCKL